MAIIYNEGWGRGRMADTDPDDFITIIKKAVVEWAKDEDICEDIFNKVDIYALSWEENDCLDGRGYEITWVRQIAMVICKLACCEKLDHIASRFDRESTELCRAFRKIKDLSMSSDPASVYKYRQFTECLARVNMHSAFAGGIKNPFELEPVVAEAAHEIEPVLVA